MADKQLFKFLNSLDNNKEKNVKKLEKFIKRSVWTSAYFMHKVFTEHYNKETIIKFMEAFLETSYDINMTFTSSKNFIQLALDEKYDMDFIIKILMLVKDHNLNINHQDKDGNTIIHTAFANNYSLDDISKLYKLAIEIGFNSSLTTERGISILGLINYRQLNTEEDALIFKEMYHNSISKNNELIETPAQTNEHKEFNFKEELNEQKKAVFKEEIKFISKEDIKFFEKYGIILNKKEFLTEPIIGREQELENLIISLAQNKIVPVLVGESGIGKTSIVDELAYMIKIDKVPSFLKNQIIVETSAASLLESTKYRGELEDKLKKLLDECTNRKIILFIDEIHLICGAGATEDSSIDISSIIRPYIDRQGIKIIGATTPEEYEKYFSSNSIKRRFDKIVVSEPEDIYLQQILEKKIKDYAFIYGISCAAFLEKYSNFIELLAEYTSKKHRVYNDNINNPSLCISIIDKAFAYARVYSCDEITLDHFIKSINSCNRIYDTSKQKIIDKTSLSVNVKRLVKVDFSPK